MTPLAEAHSIIRNLQRLHDQIGPSSPQSWRDLLYAALASARNLERALLLEAAQEKAIAAVVERIEVRPLRRQVGPFVKPLRAVRGDDDGPKDGAA